MGSRLWAVGTIECDGCIIEIFTQNSEVPVDVFNAVVDYELLENSIDVEEKKEAITNDSVL